MNITPEQIQFALPTMSKEEAIKLAGDYLIKERYCDSKYIESIFKKTKEYETYVGNGIALPHGLDQDRDHVLKTGIIIQHFPQGISYDNHTVYLLITIASNSEEHIELLQELALKFSDEDYVAELINQKNKEAFIEKLNESEE